MQDVIPIKLEQCELSLTGAKFDDQLDWQGWIRIGHRLIAAARCTQWMLGDWINFGAVKWGDKYKAALEVVDYDEGTLRNWAWVCDAVQLSRRRDKLTFGHHQEVAPMKPHEQDEWLNLAEKSEWSVSQLRCAIRTANADPDSIINGHGSFNVLKGVLDLRRWFQFQVQDAPISEWPADTRAKLKEELRPIVEMWGAL